MIKWRYITGECESASSALAADEFLMGRYGNWPESNFPEPILRIYTYSSHNALIGRFQNPEAEVDLNACQRLGVSVNRRMTGGGAVLMGEQQLMVAIPCSISHPFIPSHPAKILPKLARGIIAGLAALGITAKYRPKNDIMVNGKKISGSADCIEKNGALLYHATVLVDFDISLMTEVLRLHPEKMADKGISTFDERLTTVSRELGAPISVTEVRDAICRGFEQAFRITAVHTPFTSSEREQIQAIEEGKYLTQEWIQQRIPAPDMLGDCVMKTPAGLIHTYVALSGNTIKSVLITGDFLSNDRLINDIESALKWGKADRDSIARTIKTVMADKPDSIRGLSADELALVIANAAASARLLYTSSPG